MSWRFIGDKKGLEPIPGIPLQASDKDFDAACKELETYHEMTPGSIKKSGLYEHVPEKPAAEPKGEEE